MPKMSGPALRDSDLIYLAIKRLEAVATKMQKLEYDSVLEMHLEEVNEWLDYLSKLIEQRKLEDG